MTAIGGTLRNWRYILQVTSALHIITPILCKYFPESPRWLLARKNDRHKSEIKSILIEIAKTNGRYSNETEQKIDSTLNLSNNVGKNEPQHNKNRFIHIFRYHYLFEFVSKSNGYKHFSSIEHLSDQCIFFRHRILILRSLIMFWNWFTNSFIIYGLGLNWKELTGNLIMNLIIGS